MRVKQQVRYKISNCCSKRVDSYPYTTSYVHFYMIEHYFSRCEPVSDHIELVLFQPTATRCIVTPQLQGVKVQLQQRWQQQQQAQAWNNANDYAHTIPTWRFFQATP